MKWSGDFGISFLTRDCQKRACARARRCRHTGTRELGDARGVALGFEALLARVGLGVASDVCLCGVGAQRPARREAAYHLLFVPLNGREVSE